MENWFINLLVPSSLFASFLAVILLLLNYLFRKSIPPVWRHLFLLLVIVRLLAIFPLPSSPFSLERLIKLPESSAIPTAFEVAESGVPDQSTATLKKPAPKAAPSITATSTLPSVIEVAPAAAEPIDWRQVMLVVWLLGSLVFAMMFVKGLVHYRGVIHRSKKPDASANLIPLLNEVIGMSNVRRIPELRLSDEVQSPAVGGLFRPTLIIPGDTLQTLTRDEIKAILFHEVGHLRRFDLHTNLLMNLAQILHWFNPLVWLVCRQVRVEAERATDQWVLRRLGTRAKATYGNALLTLLQSDHVNGSRLQPATIGIAESKEGLKQRIFAIANYQGATPKWIGLCCAIITLGAAGTALTESPKSNGDKLYEFNIDFELPDSIEFPAEGLRLSVLGVSMEGDEIVYNQSYRIKNNQRFEKRLMAPAPYLSAHLLYRDGEEDMIGVANFIAELSIEEQRRLKLEGFPTSTQFEWMGAVEQKIMFKDVDEKPIGNLLVTIFAFVENNFSSALFLQGETTREGSLSILIPENASFNIMHVDAKYTQPKAINPVYKVNWFQTHQVKLMPATTLKGKVISPDGSPVSGASLVSYRVDGTGARTVSDSSGDFELRHLNTKGEHQIQITHDDWSFEPQTISLQEWGSGVAEFKALEDRDPKSVNVKFINAETNQPIKSVFMTPEKANQRWEHPTPEGFHSIDYNPMIQRDKDGNRYIDVAIWPIIPKDTVNGIVVDKEGGPIQGAMILESNMPSGTSTDENGKFSMVVPYHGDNEQSVLIAEHLGQRSAPAYWDKRSGASVVLSFGPRETGVVNGTVESDSGHPLAGAKVVIQTADYRQRQTFTGISDTNGWYELTDVPANLAYSVEISHSGHLTYRSYSDLKTLPGKTTTYATRQLQYVDQQISGKVVDQNGIPIRNGLIFVSNPFEVPRNLFPINDDGEFRLTGLVDDWIEFKIDARNLGVTWPDVQIRAGAEDIVLTMPERTKKRNQAIELTGKPAPALLVEHWLNPAFSQKSYPGNGRTMIANLDLFHEDFSLEELQTLLEVKLDHPTVDLLVLQHYTPRQRLSEYLDKIKSRIRLDLPIGIEPVLGGLSEEAGWWDNSEGGYIVIDSGKIVVHTRRLQEALDFLNQ